MWVCMGSECLLVFCKALLLMVAIYWVFAIKVCMVSECLLVFHWMFALWVC